MGWGTDDWRTRKSKRGDHGPANPAYGEKMQSRNLEDIGVGTLAADTIQQPAHAPHRQSKQKTLKKSCD
jgi:hypothetical protein